jgi:trk system potassium uptake protein
MPDLRPVAHIIGLMLVAVGAFLLIPAALELWTGQGEPLVFVIAAAVTALTGTLTALATRNALGSTLSIRQSFLLTTVTWVVLPAFGALPLVLKSDPLPWLDAYFEAVSGMTTAGTTAIPAIEALSAGQLLWRSLLQWLGGLGIVIVALIFLPVMKVGGMQHFRSEGFDTMGKILPRVADLSLMLLQIYAALTILAMLGYLLSGMGPFDAVNHGLTTIATGGFSTRDTSLGGFGPATHYVAALFMWLAGLPFIRYVQLVNGDVRPLWQDVQVRAYFRWTLYALAAILAYRMLRGEAMAEETLRLTLINTISIFSGTGYGAGDVAAWGDLPLLILIVVGFIGACTASTGCSIKVFRFLVLFEAIKVQLRQLIHPSRVIPIHIDGRRVDEEVIASVIVMFIAFMLGFGVLMILLSLTGLEARTSITAAWTAICNVGPAFGPEVGPTGAVDGFPPAAKWLMIAGMLMGRLEMVAVLVLLLPRFWRG